MDSNLQSLLSEFKQEVDELANEFFLKASRYTNTGVQGYALFKLNNIFIDTALSDYNKVFSAFTVISSERIEKFTKDKNTINYLDKNNTLQNISYTKDEAKSLAIYILKDEKKLFIEALKPIMKNDRLVDRYTKEIFGQSIKKN